MQSSIKKKKDRAAIEEGSACQMILSCDFRAKSMLPVVWDFQETGTENWVFMEEEPNPSVSRGPQNFSSKLKLKSHRSAAGFYRCRFKNSTNSNNSNSAKFSLNIFCIFYLI